MWSIVDGGSTERGPATQEAELHGIEWPAAPPEECCTAKKSNDYEGTTGAEDTICSCAHWRARIRYGNEIVHLGRCGISSDTSSNVWGAFWQWHVSIRMCVCDIAIQPPGSDLVAVLLARAFLLAHCHFFQYITNGLCPT